MKYRLSDFVFEKWETFIFIPQFLSYKSFVNSFSFFYSSSEKFHLGKMQLIFFYDKVKTAEMHSKDSCTDLFPMGIDIPHRIWTINQETWKCTSLNE